MSDNKPTTFKDALAKQKAAGVASDLSNLASAYSDLDILIAKAKELQGRIAETATKVEAGELVDNSVIRKLYEEARNI